jgi:hypothetical protein
MNLTSKIKVTDLKSLQLEKRRLQEICEIKKLKLNEKLGELKNNYPELALRAFLPFDDVTNKLLFKGVKWVSNKVSGYGGSSDSRIGKFMSGKGGSFLRAALVYIAVRFLRKILFKLKR